MDAEIVKTAIYVDKQIVADFRARVVELYGRAYGHMTKEFNNALRERTKVLEEKIGIKKQTKVHFFGGNSEKD